MRFASRPTVSAQMRLRLTLKGRRRAHNGGCPWPEQRRVTCRPRQLEGMRSNSVVCVGRCLVCTETKDKAVRLSFLPGKGDKPRRAAMQPHRRETKSDETASSHQARQGQCKIQKEDGGRPGLLGVG